MAVFISFSPKINNFNIIGGLRYEFTNEMFTEGYNKNPFIDRKYNDFYPNISISKKIKNVDLGIAFNKRTSRPSFSQLNGNVVYVNRFVFQRGNPYLNKSNIYDINLQATMNPFYLNIGYVYTKNPVLLYFKTEENKDGAILSTFANFPEYKTLNATLNWNPKITFWNPNYTIGLEKPFFNSIYEGKEISHNKIHYYFRAFNDLTLPQGFILSCNYRYQSTSQDAFYELEKWHRIDLGLRKSLFDNSLRLNLMLYDIFDWVRENASVKIENLYWSTNKKRETRYATFSISYMFNNYKKKYRGENAAQDDINRF